MTANDMTTKSGVDRWYDHLVDPEWLSHQIDLGAQDLVVVDMRGRVKTTDRQDGTQAAAYLSAKDEYLQAHIPGAVYIDWTTDIVDVDNPVPAQAASGAKISALFGSLGIGDSTQIVAYDAHPSMQFATRLWWICRYFGNTNVRLIDGGWRRWMAENRPTSIEIPSRTPRIFTTSLHNEWAASAADVLEIIENQYFANDSHARVRIVDARDVEQFTGRIIRGKRGGHIPGAINMPREAIFNASGRLLEPAALRAVFSAAGISASAGSAEEPRIVAYCNGGVAATSVLFALSILGYSHLTNYDGSWNEWNLDPSLPVEA